ncbi:MAG: hypothetical protein GF309_09290 [Candidatus Lokiarchaeota archaeon]|nr:hypothetical protein [Candidatus Lokiarchaeota archaeon]
MPELEFGKRQETIETKRGVLLQIEANTMRNQTSFALCIIGGFLLIIAGYTQGVSTIHLIYNFTHSIPALSSFYWLIDLVLYILWIIALAGGFAVIFGGYLLTTSHVLAGKFIIAIASGFGLFSLIITIIHALIVFGLAGLLVLAWLIMNSAWALGLVLTIVAREKA